MCIPIDKIMLLTLVGYIPINPVMNLTIMHIPVIIGAIVEGPLAGMIIGFVFGAINLLAIWLIKQYRENQMSV